MKAQADAVIGLIKEQQLVDPVVIGHSMGGGVALALAAMAGKHEVPGIAKLVVVDPVAYSPTKPLLGLDLGRLSEFGEAPISPDMSYGLVKQILHCAYYDAVQGHGCSNRGICPRIVHAWPIPGSPCARIKPRRFSGFGGGSCENRSRNTSSGVTDDPFSSLRTVINCNALCPMHR